MDCAALSWRGRFLQMLGAATEKAQSQRVDSLLCGAAKSNWLD